MGSVRISEMPSDFIPLLVREEDRIVCYGHRGVAVHLGCELTDDPAENLRRMERLRYSIWWCLELSKRGIDPEDGGMA
jgi:hypothetical protein